MCKPSAPHNNAASPASLFSTAATVVAVCVSARKGEAKRAVASAECRADHGLVGDAHAGPCPRQVSLMARADVDEFTAGRLKLAPGAFGENLLIDGLDVSALQPGDRLVVELGPVLAVTSIGKDCHNQACAIKRASGDCIMPRKGVFARVVCTGTLAAGQRVRHVRPPTE